MYTLGQVPGAAEQWPASRRPLSGRLLQRKRNEYMWNYPESLVDTGGRRIRGGGGEGRGGGGLFPPPVAQLTKQAGVSVVFLREPTRFDTVARTVFRQVSPG